MIYCYAILHALLHGGADAPSFGGEAAFSCEASPSVLMLLYGTLFMWLISEAFDAKGTRQPSVRKNSKRNGMALSVGNVYQGRKM